MSNIKNEKATSPKVATNPFNPTSNGGGVNLDMKVTIGADASSQYGDCPRQVQLLCNYIHELGGTATMRQINEFSVTATGNQFWGRGDSSYEQTPSKITAHYSSKLFGSQEWSKKLGKLEILRVTK